jgi:hypothetical protein
MIGIFGEFGGKSKLIAAIHSFSLHERAKLISG